MMLVLSMFLSIGTVAFASETDLSDGNESRRPSETVMNSESGQNPDDNEGQLSDSREIAGYTIPEDPEISFEPQNTFSYSDGTTNYILATGSNEKYTFTKLFTNGALCQKSIGDKGTYLVYTELYDGETDASESDIVKDDLFTYITVHKDLSDEEWEECSLASDSIQPLSNSADAMQEEPAENTGLSKSPYQADSGYYKLGTNSVSYGGPTYTGTLYRRTLSLKYVGQARKPYEISKGTAVSSVMTVLSIYLSPTGIGALLGIGSIVLGETINYATSVKFDLYNLDGSYKVRVNSAGNNPYFSTQRVISYFKLYNTAIDRYEYQMRRYEDGYPLGNTTLVNEGISNYTTYQFYDIVNHWGKEHIKWAYGKKYVAGTGTYVFSPDSATTRAMAISIIYRMAGSPAAGTSTNFTDVSTSAYYAKEVNWGVKNKIVSGTSPTTFSPNSAVTKEQFVTMLYNYAKYQGKNVSASASLSQFSDGSSVSSFAQNAMKWAVAKKIIVGDNGYLKPKKSTTRAELCVMIHSYSDKA